MKIFLLISFYCFTKLILNKKKEEENITKSVICNDAKYFSSHKNNTADKNNITEHTYHI